MASAPVPSTAPAPAPQAPPARPAFTLAAVPPLAWVVMALVVAFLSIAFRVPLVQMVTRWAEKDSYYSHGFLVPFIALYLLWSSRDELAALPRRGHLSGLLILLFGLFLYLAAGFFSVFFLGALAFVVVLWGLGGFLFGAPFLRHTLFVLLVLLFMVPLPMAWIEDISLHMKLFAAHSAVVLMRTAGLGVVDDGSTIYLNDAVVQVGAACSGLSSLISLIFLGVLFAYFVKLPLWRRVVLVLASMPIAIAANIVRVVILSLVANYWGTDKIRVGGLVHDGTGYLIFVIAFALLWITVRVLSLGTRGPDNTPPLEPSHV